MAGPKVPLPKATRQVRSSSVPSARVERRVRELEEAWRRELQARTETQEAIDEAILDGCTWVRVAQVLGTTDQTARERHRRWRAENLAPRPDGPGAGRA